MENFALNHQLMSWLYVGAYPSQWQLWLGTFAAVYLGYLFIFVLLYQGLRHRERRALIIVIFISIVLSVLISQLIQHFLPTARPYADGIVTNWIPHQDNNSFPSDHMLVTACVAFGFIFGRVYRLGFFLLLLALFVGWGRVYMGLHYPLDMLGGLVIGLVCSFICVKGLLSFIQHALLKFENK